MKIYHTETQADYHALIIELEDQGCFWAYGGKSTKWRDEIWEVYKGSTCVGVQSNKQMQYCGIDYYKEEYPYIPIIKYKAKQEGHSMTPEQEEAYKRTQVDKAERHKEIAEELNAIYISKNHDYGDSFGETFKKLGIISAVTRIADKTNRLVNLSVNERQVEDESIEDTLRDLANYAILTLIELEIHEK